MRQDPVHQPRCRVVHPPGGARWAEATPLAGQAHQQLVAAVPATHAREAMGEDPAGEIALELRLDEPRESGALGGAAARLFEEGAQVSADGGVQERVLRFAPAPLAGERPPGCAGELLIGRSRRRGAFRSLSATPRGRSTKRARN